MIQFASAVVKRLDCSASAFVVALVFYTNSRLPLENISHDHALNSKTFSAFINSSYGI